MSAQDDFDWVALTALAVSGLAFVVTFAQLLAQCFATADGYRKCQASVMGPWGRQTKLRWRWTEFRFETLYLIPRISFVQALSSFKADEKSVFAPLCARPELLANPEPRKDWHGELVGWVYMLRYLKTHDTHAGRGAVRALFYGKGSSPNSTMDFHRVPLIDVTPQSWDFMPEDVVRPLAMTNACTIAILARRLGMIWRQFDPYEGVFRAEGNHQVIASTIIRGIGTVIQYSRDPVMDTDPVAQAHIRATSPSSISDDLGFGKVGGAYHFGTRVHLQIGCVTDVVATLPLLFSDTTASPEPVLSALRAANEKGDKEWMALANDIVPFLTPSLGVSSSETLIIPWPNSCARGLTFSPAAARLFTKQLNDLVDSRGAAASHHSRTCLAHMQSLLDTSPASSSASSINSAFFPPTTTASSFSTANRVEMSRLHAVLHELTTTLYDHPIVHAGRYSTLIAAHLLAIFAPTSTPVAAARTPASPGPNTTASLVITTALAPQPMSTSSDNVVKKLFSSLDTITSIVQTSWALPAITSIHTPLSDEPSALAIPETHEIIDAYLLMLVRAFIWQRIHFTNASLASSSSLAGGVESGIANVSAAGIMAGGVTGMGAGEQGITVAAEFAESRFPVYIG